MSCSHVNGLRNHSDKPFRPEAGPYGIRGEVLWPSLERARTHHAGTHTKPREVRRMVTKTPLGAGRRGRDLLLRDGGTVVVRAIEADDMVELEGLHERMSADSLRHRFFGTGTGLAHNYLDHLSRSPRTIALVGVIGGRILGLGTAEPLGSGRAEAAFVVDEESHGLGLGTILLEQLAVEARAQDIRELVVEVMCENREMLDVISHAGFATSSNYAGDTVHVVLKTAADEPQVVASEQRKRVAEENAQTSPGRMPD